MNREQADQHFRDRVGRPKDMTAAQLDRGFFNHTPPVPEKDWPYRSSAVRFSGVELRPRMQEPDDCPECEGGKVKVTSGPIRGSGATGNVRYTYHGPCKACEGTGKALAASQFRDGAGNPRADREGER